MLWIQRLVFSLGLLALARGTLISQASAGDLAGVKQSLEDGTDVNSKDSYGNSALMWASWMGRREVVELLIANDASVNAQDFPASDTALTKAAFNGNTSVVKALLSAGADLHHSNKFGISALMNAAMQGHAETAEELIRAGADVMARDQGVVTALHKAASKSHNKMISILIAAGAEVDAKRQDGVTPIMMTQPSTTTFNLLKKFGAKEPPMKRRDL